MAGTQQYATQRQGISDANLGFKRGLYTAKMQEDALARNTAMDNAMRLQQARLGAFGNIAGGALETGLSLFARNGGVIPKAEHGMKIPTNKNNTVDMMKKYQMGGNVLAQIMGGAGGGMPPVQGPLPGEASHETNPMDIVDKNGVKQGEAMGGEFIVNAEQAEGMMSGYESVRQLIDAGKQPTQEEWMAFYDSIDEVLSQPQFDESEGAPQMMG